MTSLIVSVIVADDLERFLIKFLLFAFTYLLIKFLPPHCNVVHFTPTMYPGLAGYQFYFLQKMWFLMKNRKTITIKTIY